MTMVALRQVYHRSSFGLIVLVSTGDGCASLLFLLTNVVLVRGVDEQGVFPRETSFFYPLLVQVENCPGRRVSSS